MCGICGIWYFDGRPIERGTLDAMCGSLRRRGPDDQGCYIDGSVALGHRRLSVIDLVTGAQPLSNEDGTVWITYNGEVYNFSELRAELEKSRHTFHTRSDTEVIVHLYEELGLGFVERLRGMFAFAIWDVRHRQIVLVRDRLGKKPLYYFHDRQCLIFASELKTLLIALGFMPNVDLAALEAYLTLDYIPAPLSIYQGVRKLPAAHLLVCRGKDVRLQRYWQPLVRPHEERRPVKFQNYGEELLELLREAVRIRMVSDVPLGVLLSGGVDSSAVVAVMAQVTNQPIQTFSIGSASSDSNELPYARLVAQRFATQHHEFIVETDSLAILPELLQAYDEPFADASVIPTFYVSRLARQHVTVALSGDGGDELFCGYPWYWLLAKEDWIMQVPEDLRRTVFGWFYRWWPAGWRGKGRLYYWKEPSSSCRYALTRNRFPDYERHSLLTADLEQALANVPPCDVVARFAAEASHLDRVSMMQYADLMTYLPEDILVKVDRASMWHSLEVRAPLLDHKLVEFVLAMPVELKLKGRDSKHILKQVISSWVPREAIYRPKKGFGIPVKHWFKREWYEFVHETLLGNRARKRGYFQPQYVARLLEHHRNGHSDPTVSTHQIWNLVYFELWCQKFADKAA